MRSTTKRVNIFKPKTPLVKPMGDVFIKTEFERDLGEFLREFVVNDKGLLYLRERSIELPGAVEQASGSGIREGVYTSLAKMLNCNSDLIPERAEYDFSPFYHSLNILDPIQTHLKANATVRRHLDKTESSLNVHCSRIAFRIDEGYIARLVESRLPLEYK